MIGRDTDGPVVLGIESSCDETAAAVVRGVEVLGAAVATQHELHREFGGVVPEIASRAHVERVLPVVRAALADAGIALDDVEAVAVGHRPGLIGALLVGTTAGKGLALGLDVPFVGVDHVHAAHRHRELLLLGSEREGRLAAQRGGHLLGAREEREALRACVNFVTCNFVTL